MSEAHFARIATALEGIVTVQKRIAIATEAMLEASVSMVGTLDGVVGTLDGVAGAAEPASPSDTTYDPYMIPGALSRLPVGPAPEHATELDGYMRGASAVLHAMSVTQLNDVVSTLKTAVEEGKTAGDLRKAATALGAIQTEFDSRAAASAFSAAQTSP